MINDISHDMLDDGRSIDNEDADDSSLCSCILHLQMTNCTGQRMKAEMIESNLLLWETPENE
jgi:hypothetical protein